MPAMRRAVFAVALAALPAVLAGRTIATKPDVDAIFARYSTTTPGCAVGVAANGTPTFAKGYGMADLEHDVPITPDTIFEVGSVSKQFTAAAVLLLARDGKLSIDDPVKKYIPELPDYPSDGPANGSGVITIRHMLNHTSGLRDWGSVASIAGWPRTTRVYTLAHVLEIVSHQKSLNFPPGTNWSYSNTGFNLAAIIVSRVSGTPFPDFTRDRIFKPLGMTHTSWRDDYTRIVKNRAIAYNEVRDRPGTFKTNMPFENVYGNGGLLTTVGDLLKWNKNFSTPVVGDAAFVELQQRPGRFNDGRTHGYAFGLYVGGQDLGTREVYHSGMTAGYSAFLARFPDQALSVAVLCNVSTNATTLAHRVASAHLAGRVPPRAPADGVALSAADIARLQGMYRNLDTGATLQIASDKNVSIRVQPDSPLTAADADHFTAMNGDRYVFDGNGGATKTDRYGTVVRFERVTVATPSPADLQAYEGVYASDEAEVEMRAAVENGTLVLKRRPDTTLILTPLYADAFSTQGLGTAIFHRDANRRPVDFTVSQDRVWKLTFRRMR